jgi:drug/metabolite transporter (DMT)-like permease
MLAEVQSSALIALAAAASWGGGDFCGGMGVKAAGGSTPSALRFVVLAHTISLLVLLGVILAMHEGQALGAPALWALAGGVAGGLGLVAFYMALSRGGMGASAAVSGLLAAAVPAGVAVVLEGVPGTLTLAGFALAAAAIWLIAAGVSPESTGESRQTMGLAIFGGVAFGFYFVALKLANPLGVVVPMALARAGSVVTLLPLLAVLGRMNGKETSQRSGRWLLGLTWALGVALLDTGGNMLFVAATRLGRMDVAAVLASLYPAATILLAAWWLHERPTRRQMAGMAVALAAVVMITV